MKEFIDYVKNNEQKRIMFIIILVVSLIIGIGAISQGAWYVGIPIIVIMNVGNLFGDWMNFKKYWT